MTPAELRTADAEARRLQAERNARLMTQGQRDTAARNAAARAEALHAAGCEVPNLDDMSTDPIDLHAAALVFGRLACYADHKGRAMELRLAGDIPAAVAFEAAAQEQYRKLPPWARW